MGNKYFTILTILLYSWVALDNLQNFLIWQNWNSVPIKLILFSLTLGNHHSASVSMSLRTLGASC